MNRIVTLVTAVGVGLGMGWVLAAQQQEKKWQGADGGREEYALYEALTKAKSPQEQKAALDAWSQKFPNSDYAGDRENAYLITYQQLNDTRAAFDMAKKIRQRRAQDLLAIDALVRLIYQFNPASEADLNTAEEAGKYALANLNTIFAADNKPLTMTPEAFAAARPQLEQLAQRIVAFVPYQKKSWAVAETEIRKFLAMDPTQAQFSQMLGNSLLQQRQDSPEKQPNALFHFARAAAYDGKNALAPAARQQMMDYVKNTYVQYHGSDEGFEQLVAGAKTNVMPAPGFTIKSKNEIEREKILADEEWKRQHPDLAFWRDIVRAPLQGPDAAMVWESMNGAGLPTENIGKFPATIISSTQEKGKTKQLVVGIMEPTVPDATLELVEPLPGMMEPGSMIKFFGAAKSYTGTPFNVTFEVDAKGIEGWTPAEAK